MRKIKPSRKELFYNQIAEGWESCSWFQIEIQKRLKVIFKDLLGGIELKNKSFLDVGCGLGYFSQKAVSLGARVTGVDIGENLIDECKKRIPTVNFLVASATNLPFDEKTFDVVLSTEVIENVEQPLKAIAEFFRVVESGGLLVLTTPNKLYKPLFDFLSFVKIRPYQGNENWFSPWHLRSILVNHGGKIIREKHFNFFYPCRFFDYFEKFPLMKPLMIN